MSELASLRLFSDVPEPVLEPLARASFARRLARGQILFTAGEPSEHMYLVRSGRVKVYVDSEQGDELLLTVLTRGDVLGELSAVDRLPRSASTQALEPSELLALPLDQVAAVLAASPAALFAVAAELAENLRRLSGATADLVFLDLPRRLAKLVLSCSDGGRVNLGLTQSELASMLGVTRPSLNRVLGGLQRRGWLEVRGQVLYVRDPDALRRFSES